MLSQKIQACQKCQISKYLPSGSCPVPGTGKGRKIMIVGEAPGVNEVMIGLPFVGAAGRMLHSILGKAQVSLNDVYITNTVKCRPCDAAGAKNRPPTDAEITACKDYLLEEIKSVAPKYIFTLGKVPTYTLLRKELKKSFKMKDIAGHVFLYDNIEVRPNYHPSYLMQYGKDVIQTATNIFSSINKI